MRMGKFDPEPFPDSVPTTSLASSDFVEALEVDCLSDTIQVEKPGLPRKSLHRINGIRQSRKRKFLPSDNSAWHPTSADEVQVETTTPSSPTVPKSSVSNQKVLNPRCCIPFNGHAEDKTHFDSCDVVSVGWVLRKKFDSWFNSIPSHSGIARIIDLVVGSCCRQTILNNMCNDDSCSFKHSIELNFEVCQKRFSIGFNIFTKWLIENSKEPNFGVLLILLSRLSKDQNDILMVVLSFTKMLMKLQAVQFRLALSVKLIQTAVNMLSLQPWEAVRALLLFTISEESSNEGILEFIDNLEILKSSKNNLLKNHLYESLSCLWHLNDSVVFPAHLLFGILEECLGKRPEDLKLTKDKIVKDLLMLPKRLLTKKFHLIDSFIANYYPRNSGIGHVVRTSIVYGIDPRHMWDRAVRYRSSRVKKTGSDNRKWKYWDINEARLKGFAAVARQNHPTNLNSDVNLVSRERCNLTFESVEDPASCDAVSEMLSNGRLLSLPSNILQSTDLDDLIESLHSNRYLDVATSLLSFEKPEKISHLPLSMQTLLQELKCCDKTRLPLVVVNILKRLPATKRSDEFSVRNAFVRTLNSLVVNFYRDFDYKIALKLIKIMRVCGVNHLEHVPEEFGDQKMFVVISSDVHFECRLYAEAIRNLMYKDCMSFESYDIGERVFNEHFFLLETVVMKMMKQFLKHRLATHALHIFRVVLRSQESLHFPLNIGRFYEGVLFVSFLTDLAKDSCSPGEGANLYISVDRICGNAVKFHSITYRSLLVELTRANSPDDVLRRTLLTCLKLGIYPDFTDRPLFPLVLGSHLATEEIHIYLFHYFTFFVDQDSKELMARPFVLRFVESPPPSAQPYPVSNDVMKTSRAVPDAMARLKTALERLAGPAYSDLDIEFETNLVTIPISGVDALLQVLRV